MSSPELQESVAIVGMAGRFPQAANLREFWQNLRRGAESISFFKDEEAGWLPIESPPDLADPHSVKARAVLERPEWFDAGFFRLNPKEAEIMDPQHRVFLECAWEALESAGCDPDTYDGMIGVFAGASMNTYLLANLITDGDRVKDFGLFASMILNCGDFLPTRVSHKFNLRGPSINVQTACSTSLVAVCLACQNLLSYRCDIALAGGVSITFPQNRVQRHQEGGILSPDGHCRPFDAKAAGTVLGDGAGVVVLKRLSEALAAGDHLCAVIKGTAVNNDGAAKIGYTAPSSAGQAEAIALALSEAQFEPDTLSYVEAHGTATPLGDPIEIEGLTRAFGDKADKTQFCAIGSVKSNIGHLDIAAGVAGLIKTVLAMEHRELPPSLHFERPNPEIDFARSPFYVNGRLRPWPAGRLPRRAGVSSFGIGGTNAHVVLEEAPAQPPTTPARLHQLLLLSARTPAALEAVTDNLAAHLRDNPTADLADIAFTLQTGRKAFPHRRSLVCQSVADAVKVLGKRESRRIATGRFDAAPPSVAFLFPGQGEQEVDMGRELYEREPAFRDQVGKSCELLRPLLSFDLREILFPGPGQAAEAARRLNQTAFAQPALFVIEHALAGLWMSWGVQPQAMIGHSLGEYVAACIAGVFTLEDALALVAERARLMQAQPAGAMVAMRLPEAQALPLLGEHLTLAAVNAPGTCVASGPFDAIEALEKRLTASVTPYKRLPASHAFHSAMMEPAARPLAEIVRRIRREPPRLPWISNVTGAWITPEEATSPDYWAEHLRRTVRFSDGIAQMAGGGGLVLLEVGPGRTLTGLARQQPAVSRSAAALVPSLGNAEAREDLTAVLRALGELWIAGVPIDWRADFHRGERRRIVPLPTYPFERKRYWIEPARGARDGAPGAPKAAPAPEKVEPRPAVPSPAAPSTIETLRTLFHDLSGVDLADIREAATYYELGFDSLFLTQASLAIGRRFGVGITFRQLREDFPTLGGLAAYLDKHGKAPPAPEARRKPTAPEPPSPSREIRLALTPAQRELWFASQLGDAMSAAYNESSIVRLDGSVAPGAIERALGRLIARHEMLRASFAPRGDVLVIAPSAAADFRHIDLSPEGEETREFRAAECIDQAMRRPFDLQKAPALRALLIQLGPRAHLLAFVVHHIVADGWSLGVLIRELGELYSADVERREPTLPAAPSFAAYVSRPESAENSPEMEAAAEFWKRQFAGGVPTLDLPADRPRRPNRTLEGGFLLGTLSAKTVEAARRLCTANDCTLATVLMAGFSTLLHRLSGQDDLVIGVPATAQVMDGQEGLVGHLANLLPVRTRLQARPDFAAHLVSIRGAMTDALEHWRYPFGSLLRQLKLARSSSRAPLAPVTFNIIPKRRKIAFAGMSASVECAPKPFVNFDLSVNFAPSDSGVLLGCYFSAELYNKATMERWFGQYETLLQTAADSKAPAADAAPRAEARPKLNGHRIELNGNGATPGRHPTEERPSARVSSEDRLTEIWKELLGVERVGPNDNFFELGGHSLLVSDVISRVHDTMGVELTMAQFFLDPTIAGLAAAIAEASKVPAPAAGGRLASSDPLTAPALSMPGISVPPVSLRANGHAPKPASSIVEIQAHGHRPPLYFVHGIGGGMFWGYSNLARYLGSDQPVYGFKSRGLDGHPEYGSIEEMAGAYLADLRRRQPHGPYHLGGYCFGGVVAHELARQLDERGERVALLALVNCSPPNTGYLRHASGRSLLWHFKFLRNLLYWAGCICFRWSMRERNEFIRWKLRSLRKRASGPPAESAFEKALVDLDDLLDHANYSDRQRALWQTHARMLMSHHPKPYAGQVTLFRTRGHPLFCSFDARYGWSELARGGVEVKTFRGGHANILDEPHVRAVAQSFRQCLRDSAPALGATASAPAPDADALQESLV